MFTHLSSHPAVARPSFSRAEDRPTRGARSMSLEQLDILRKACADVRKADDGGPGWSEAWAALHFLCPEVAPGAAEILDSKMITRVVARHSRREFFLVEGSQKRDYTCMPGFCTCDYYCQRVATRPDALVCKHELAVLLAGSLGVAHQCELDDGEWATKFELAISVDFQRNYGKPGD